MFSRLSARANLIALFAAAAALTACGGGGSSADVAPPPPAPSPPPAPPPPPPPPPPPSPATQYVVTAQSTDPSIDPSFGSHYAYINGSVAAKGKLFVFLPATQSVPKNYTIIGSAAADAGLHSIGLAYPNGPSPVELLCKGSSDPDCTTKIREETYSGADATPLVSVDPPNAVLNRLGKLLVYLNQQHPADGWGQFLGSGNSIRWDLVRVSGLSQGGGGAGYIAKQKQAVDRACFFSSPADWDDVNNQPGGWIMAAGSLTPSSRIYGFNHLKDPIVPYAHIQATWTRFGLDGFGGPVGVDVTQAYGGTHELTTNLGNAISAHTSTASDGNTPLDASGAPVYGPVWNYACFN